MKQLSGIIRDKSNNSDVGFNNLKIVIESWYNTKAGSA